MYQGLEETPMSLRDDLSDNAQVILEGLYECGGVANMTEMKQVTGLEESKTILYHTEEYLEPSNFVEYEIIDDGSATGITEFTLTDRGQDAVGSLIESTDDPNLVEQVEELREAVSDMKREVDTFAGRLDHTEQQFEEVQDRLMSADEAVTKAEEVVERAEIVVEEHEAVGEVNAELRNRIRKMEEVERIMKELGFVRNDAIGGWENSEEGGFLKGPLLKKLETLHEEGVIDQLGERHVEGKRFGPFSDDDSESR
jgi:DNA-binding Lrp family transcriptional regulator